MHTLLSKAGHSPGDVSQDWRPFHFISPLPLPLFCLLTLVPHCVCLSDSTEETGIPTDWQGGFFWGTSLPSSQSAGSQLKSLPASTCLLDSLAHCAVSRASLDSVTTGQWNDTSQRCHWYFSCLKSFLGRAITKHVLSKNEQSQLEKPQSQKKQSDSELQFPQRGLACAISGSPQ